MKTTINIKKAIKEIQSLIDRQNTMSFDDRAWQTVDDQVWAKINELDTLAGKGLVPGRHLSFGVADGSAHYIITKVHKTTVDVEHLPYMDNYHFNGVYEGKIMAGVAARQLAMADGLKELFKKK